MSPYTTLGRRWQVPWPIFLLLLLLNPLLILASPLQYCAVNEKHKTDQCLVVSSYYNETSNGNDLYLFLSARFEGRKGYAAFGTGMVMHGSLMFVIYPGETEGDVTFSLRTTRFHNPPEVASDAPAYSVVSTSVDGPYHNAGVVCYSCDAWSGSGVSVTSKYQSWIFANSYECEMETNDLSKPLSLHTDYDIFELDMTASHSTTDTPSPPELVDSSRHSVLGPTASGRPALSLSRQVLLYTAHGTLLSFSFLIIMPTAIAGMRNRGKNSFRVHWITQIASVTVAATGLGLGLYPSGLTIQLPSIRGTHQLIGLLLVVCLLIAPSLGYLHHLRYLKLGRRTALTEWHRAIGYSAMTGGWVNIILGLCVTGKPLWWPLAAVGLCAISSCYIWAVPKLWHWERGSLRPRYTRLEQLSS